jgi:hypothetical protein
MGSRPWLRALRAVLGRGRSLAVLVVGPRHDLPRTSQTAGRTAGAGPSWAAVRRRTRPESCGDKFETCNHGGAVESNNWIGR